MSISMIAAIGRNNELGKGNDLIWHFKEDMRFFKDVTTGNTVVMGRKTFESLPHSLPNRRNIVITTDRSYIAEGAEVVDSVDAALKTASDDDVFVIGGGKIYAQFLALADKLYITEIDAVCPDAEVFFPHFNRDDYRAKQLASYDVDGIHFEHILYEKL